MSYTENNLPSAEYLDPRDFYAVELEHWRNLWDRNKSIYQNVESIIDNAVFFPNREIILPLVTVYTLVPSKWSKILGVLLCYGKEGSGKSTVSHIACKLHGHDQTFSATDTFASIRNALNEMRWLTNDRMQEKEGVILCWDNIHASTLTENKSIYQMLLFGYNRASERISIAGSGGQNQDFYVFSPKILSTVDSIHINTNFKELHRRIYLVPHKPYNLFLANDKKQYADRNIEDRLDIDSINWNGIEDEFFKFWQTPENAAMYAKLRTALTRRNSHYKRDLPTSITPERWTITVDLIVTGIITGKWEDATEAIAYFGEYWNYFDNEMLESSATVSHLKAFIEEEVGREIEMSQKLVEQGFKPADIYISANKLKDRVNFHAARGELDITATNREIASVMLQIGWRLTARGWKQI